MRPVHFLPVLVVAALTSSLASQSVLQRWYGDAGSRKFGTAVRFVGDVDADGHADVAATAAGFYPRYLEVVSGRTGSVLFRADEVIDVDRLQFRPDRLGDVDGDGFDDVCFGSNDEGAPTARILAFDVRSGRDGSVLFTARAPYQGTSVGLFAVGDVDADGRQDVAVFSGSNVRVLAGRDGSVIRTFPASGNWIGRAGDANADGYDDIRVDQIATFMQGRVTVYSGRDSSLLFQVYGNQLFDDFGGPVAPAGDVNGDGFDDLIAGSPLEANASGVDAGRVRVFSGADGSVLHDIVADYGTLWFGSAVAGAGDLDGDGHADFLVGAPRYANANGSGAGEVRLYSGASGALLQTFLGESQGDWLGGSIDGGADLDGDGYPDVVAGAVNDDDGGLDAGGVLAFDAGFVGSPAHARELGAACEGSNGGLPHIGIRGRPAIGHTVKLTLRAAVGNAGITLVLGSPVDVPLDAIGMQGCR